MSASLSLALSHLSIYHLSVFLTPIHLSSACLSISACRSLSLCLSIISLSVSPSSVSSACRVNCSFPVNFKRGELIMHQLPRPSDPSILLLVPTWIDLPAKVIPVGSPVAQNPCPHVTHTPLFSVPSSVGIHGALGKPPSSRLQSLHPQHHQPSTTEHVSSHDRADSRGSGP